MRSNTAYTNLVAQAILPAMGGNFLVYEVIAQIPVFGQPPSGTTLIQDNRLWLFAVAGYCQFPTRFPYH